MIAKMLSTLANKLWLILGKNYTVIYYCASDVPEQSTVPCCCNLVLNVSRILKKDD